MIYYLRIFGTLAMMFLAGWYAAMGDFWIALIFFLAFAAACIKISSEEG